MSTDRNLLILAVLAGLVIGWLLGAGWWHVPGRSIVVFLAFILIVVLIVRSRGNDVQTKQAVKSVGSGASKKIESSILMSQSVKETDDAVKRDGEVLSGEAAREWLDDLLVTQQKD